MSWFYLALLAPLLFAIVNLIDDNLIHHVYKSSYFGAIISGLFGAIPLFALLFLSPNQISVSVLVMGVLAGFLTTVYYFFYFKALELDSPSVAIALYSLSPAMIPFLAFFFLKERLLPSQIAGFIVVLIASFGLALAEVKKFKFSKALLPMATASTMFALTTLQLKYVYEHTNFFTGFMLFSAGMGLGAIYFLLVLKFLKASNFFKDLRRNSRRIFVLFVLSEAIAILAGFTQNLAIERGPVSLVTVVGGAQPIYVLLIALVFYKISPKHFREAAEGGLPKKFALMFVIIFGLFLITLEA